VSITAFAGIWNAFDFAYGQNPQAPALQVISGSNVAGTYTLTCSPTTAFTKAGLPIAPALLQPTPITVGASTTLETVTPTAVSINSLGQILITAVFAFAHGSGDQVRSGDGGIVEAMNAAHAAGGGLVAVDLRCQQAVAATHAALVTFLGTLHGWANVVVLDYTGFNTTPFAQSWYAGAAGAPVDAGLLVVSTHILY
jgi:hypothetical protein